MISMAITQYLFFSRPDRTCGVQTIMDSAILSKAEEWVTLARDSAGWW